MNINNDYKKLFICLQRNSKFNKMSKLIKRSVYIIVILLLRLMIIACISNLSMEESNQPIKLGYFSENMVGVPQAEVGKRLAQSQLTMNPEELGLYFEGDIIQPRKLSRNGLLDEIFRWPNGIVPVEVRGNFDASNLEVINSAIKIYHNSTCIRLIQHSSEEDFVVITNTNTGCWSSVGRIGGTQIINLQTPHCMTTVGTTLHEIMHALGFNHEQSREDRDEHIRINWENVDPEHKYNFEKAETGTTTGFDVEYDYGSILHYSPFAFAKNKTKPTLEPLNLNDEYSTKVMGQRKGFANSDIEKIWKMYKCTGTTSSLSASVISPKPKPSGILPVLNIVNKIFSNENELKISE